MDGMRFLYTYHNHGTLTGDINIHFKAPCDCTLVRVDCVTTTAAVGTMEIGTEADRDGYLPAFQFGASNVPTTAGRADFTGALLPVKGEYPRLRQDDVIRIYVNNGSMVHPDFVLTFLEG